MKTARIILIYLAAALAAAVCGVLFGAARIPLSEFVQDGALNPIVELRIVRTAAAAVVGASLAVSGLIFPSIGPNAAMLRVAAAVAIFDASATDFPSISPQRNAASKLSPAPVASTGFAL